MNDEAVQERYRLDGTADSITEARHLARDFFRRCTPPLEDALLRDALLAVSELATNAVRHAPGPYRLDLADDHRRLTIAVTDTHPTMPAPRTADLAGGGGVGLHVLRGLAGQVETTAHTTGKTVVISLQRSRESV